VNPLTLPKSSREALLVRKRLAAEIAGIESLEDGSGDKTSKIWLKTRRF
jgi:hypothetical protein